MTTVGCLELVAKHSYDVLMSSIGHVTHCQSLLHLSSPLPHLTVKDTTPRTCTNNGNAVSGGEHRAIVMHVPDVHHIVLASTYHIIAIRAEYKLII